MPTINQVLNELLQLKYPHYPNQVEAEDKQIAGFFDISAASYSNYKTGKRGPRKDNATSMAKAWARHLLESVPEGNLAERVARQGHTGRLDEESLQSWINGKLVSAKAIDTSGDSEEPPPLRVSFLDYGVFAGSKPEAFFRHVYQDRFLKQLGRECDAVERTTLNLEDLLRRNETDLGTCYFAATSRADGTRFYTTPLRVSLAAVTTSRHHPKTERLAEWLCEPNTALMVKPIVVRKEVGHLYFKHALGYDDENLDIEESIDIGSLHSRLSQADEEVRKAEEAKKRAEEAKKRAEEAKSKADQAKRRAEEKTGKTNEEDANEAREAAQRADEAEKEAARLDKFLGQIPVVLVDEYTALRLLGELGTKGLLITPVTTSYTTQHSRYRREFPLYFMGVACRRNDTQLSDLLDATLNFFFTTEVETTALALSTTFKNLRNEVEKVARHLGYWRMDRFGGTETYTHVGLLNEAHQKIIARQYALFSLSLNRSASPTQSAYAPYWSPILARARRMVDEEIFQPTNRPATVKIVADLLKEQQEDKERLNEISALEDICHYFDHTFELKQLRGHSAVEIVALAEATLLGKELVELLKVQAIAPNQIKDWRQPRRTETIGLLELLNQVTTLYRELRDGVNVDAKKGENIAKEIAAEFTQGFSRYAQIFYASASTTSENADHPAGMVFVMEEPGCRRDDWREKPAAFDAGYERIKRILETRCELRYLRVSRHYRGHNLSRVLISRALDWCREQKYFDKDTSLEEKRFTHMRVAILPALEEALRRFRALGFEPVSEDYPTEYDDVANPGHIILERKL
ncbi:MAG: hypothetical protein U0Q16_19860 [Bryobacteraceae bacterium]